MPGLGFLRSSFLWKISLTNLALIVLITLGFSLTVFFQLRSAFEEDVHRGLSEKTALISPYAKSLLENPGALSETKIIELSIDAQARISIIDAKGRVVADSSFDPTEMNNHLGREEIVAASRDGVGFSWRYSDTLSLKMAYFARKIVDGERLVGYIRLAYPESAIQKKINSIKWTLILITGLGIFLTFILGTLLARSITIPLSEMQSVCNAIRKGDYHSRVKKIPKDEIGHLGMTLNHLSEELIHKITDLSLEKTQLRTTLAGMVEGLISLEKNGTIRFCNQAAYTLLNSPVSDCRGRHYSEVEGFSCLVPLIERIDDSRQFIEDEIKVKSADFYKTLEVRINYFRKADAEGYLVLLHDVSHLRQLERVRRDFVANVSHELKTPLTAIKGYSETLINGAINDPENAQRFVEKIEGNARQLSDIVTDLLSLARIESTDPEIVTQPIDLNRAIDGALARFEDSLAKKKIVVDRSQVGGGSVLADDESIQLILDNLISNAIRYSPDEGKVLLRTELDADRVCLTVEDTGIGIPENDIDKIFERFYRVDKARSKKLGGTGLGLAIVKHLVVRLGGEVSVHSVLGVGSQFSVTLPRV